MAYKILERALCPDCEKLFTDAHIVHKEVPYSQGTAQCERCHKKDTAPGTRCASERQTTMNRTKPLSKAEINERALWIAADMLTVAGYSTEDGEPGEPHKLRRWIRNKARRELLNERRERNRA